MFELDATRLGLNDPQGVNADRILLRSLRAQDDHVPALQKGQRLALPRRLWETEEEFDHFVHTDLLAVMVQSKRQYHGRIHEVAGNAFELLFGD